LVRQVPRSHFRVLLIPINNLKQLLIFLSIALGTIDTAYQWPETRGLGDLLVLNGIPYQRGSLHCAGNDAHYTLRLLLVFMLEKVGPPAYIQDITPAGIRRIEVARELVARALPKPSRRDQFDNDDWQHTIDGDLGTDLFLGLLGLG